MVESQVSEQVHWECNGMLGRCQVCGLYVLLVLNVLILEHIHAKDAPP